MNILLIGTTGVGKTTIAKELCLLMENDPGNGHWHYLSSGDVARKYATDKDKELFKRGELFSDERLIRWKMLNAINNIHYFGEEIEPSIILDGFPRNRDQFEFIEMSKAHIDIAFYLELDFHIVVERIKSRSRDDTDTIETAMARTTRERGALLNLWSCIKTYGIPHEWINVNDRDLSSIVAQMKNTIDMVV